MILVNSQTIKALPIPINKLLFCCFIFWSTPQAILAQTTNDIVVRAGFFKDSLIVGDQTQFYLAARYPQNKTMVFPDSTVDFTPFEYEKRTYFPTKTKAGFSYDSVIYQLSTFEIERVQQLKLAVYELTAHDSIFYYSNTDSILLTPLVTIPLDTIPAENLPLKRNVAYQNVSLLFNYPIATIILATLLVLMAMSWFIFGKKIKQYFRARRLQRAHTAFSKEFTDRVLQVNETYSPQTVEAALALWKKYMEQLEAKPYTKLTTRETRLLNPDEKLIVSLQTIDGAIYGYSHPETLVQSLQQLQAFANHHFEDSLRNINNGR